MNGERLCRRKELMEDEIQMSNKVIKWIPSLVIK